MIVLIIFFLCLTISHIFLKREGFWSITPDNNKKIPDDFASSYTAINVESNLRSAYSNVDEFAKVCANKIPLTATYDTMVITENPTDNKYLCYVTDMIDPASTPTPQTDATTLPLFADLTGLHSYCEVLGSGDQKVCPDNQKLCYTDGADPENCCNGWTSVSINKYDDDNDKVTWRCSEKSGLPSGGLTKCPPGYKLARKGNLVPLDKFDTCIRHSEANTTSPPQSVPNAIPGPTPTPTQSPFKTKLKNLYANRFLQTTGDKTVNVNKKSNEEWIIMDSPKKKGVMICNNNKKCITAQTAEYINSPIRLTDYEEGKEYTDNRWIFSKIGDNEYTICTDVSGVSNQVCLENTSLGTVDDKTMLIARDNTSHNPLRIKWQINNLPDYFSSNRPAPL